LAQTIPELRTTADHNKLAEDMIKALENSFLERLKQRVQGAEERLQKAGGTFHFEVRRCGDVRDELERSADQFDADIVVFSRHQKIHRRPFLVGRVTYQAMLSQKRGVMVVP
jgi:nucleotide-binding universal stress UspA family protein